jgi:hypothetical protein
MEGVGFLANCQLPIARCFFSKIVQLLLSSPKGKQFNLPFVRPEVKRKIGTFYFALTGTNYTKTNLRHLRCPDFQTTTEQTSTHHAPVPPWRDGWK